jgi:hypothetical protein
MIAVKKRPFSSIASSARRGSFRWSEKIFNEQEQSGILAQKNYVCGNLRQRFSSTSAIQHVKKKVCQVATL